MLFPNSSSIVSSSSSLSLSCDNITEARVTGAPTTSALMFALAAVGNALALFILGVHRRDRRTKSSVFCILVTGLALTDLLGTCLLSPPVFVCYGWQLSLLGLTPRNDPRLCQLFAFLMTFFGLAPTLILCAMAVERCLALSHPYLYSRYVRRSFAKATLLGIYVFAAGFCALPLLGFGRHRQYCPGTWCFIDMDRGSGAAALAFSLSYSSLMLTLITAVFVCNGSVIASLCKMHRGQALRRGSTVLQAGKNKRRRMSVMAIMAIFGQEEEMEHLALLASMTVIFAVCSLPLTIAGFVNAVEPSADNDKANLTAFRFYAFNPIVDPWVFILCRRAVGRHLWSLLSAPCRFTRNAMKTKAHHALSLPSDICALQNTSLASTAPRSSTDTGLPP